MKKIRTLYKDSKKNSLFGMKAKRKLKIMIMALALVFAISGMCFASGSTAGKVAGVALCTAPIFSIPGDLNLKDEEKKGLEALASHFQKQFEAFEKGTISKEDMGNFLSEKLKAFTDEFRLDKEKFKALENALKEQGLAIKAFQEEGAKVNRETFAKKLENLLTSDNFKDAIKSGKVQEMTIKAPATITTANATNAPHALSYEVIPGIQAPPQEDNVIFPTLSKGSTSSRTIIWINRVDKEGGAAFIAEGVLKPLKDWTYAEENSTAKKVAVSAKISMEMLNDFAYMRGEIETLLKRDLLTVVDAKLLAGNGTDEPKGIISVAGGYVGTSLDGTISTPNNADAIRASMLQMRLLNYKPNVVFMNPSDVASLDLTKSSTGNYIKIELDAVMQKIRVIETTEIAAGQFLLMDTAKWIVKVLEDLRLEFGWENDDFRKNLVTVIAEMRLHSYQNSIDAGAEVYDSFAIVKTALNKA